MLGVEIMAGRGEPSAAPILAVETAPRAFATQPISRLIEQRFSAGFAPILPAGRFHGKAKEPEDGPEASFDAMIDVDEPQPPRDEAGPTTRESLAARRQRLRAAPFVE